MPRTRKQQKDASWTYVTGEKGANRVRVFVHRNGNLYAEYKRHGRKARQSLGHADHERAKLEAESLAVQLRLPERQRAVTLGELFDNYLNEVTPTKSPSKQAHDRRALERFRTFLGADALVEDLTHRDAARFAVMRSRQGDQRPRKKVAGSKKVDNNPHPIRSRMVIYDLKALRAVFNWAIGARFIERNPLFGFRMKDKETPNRPVFTEQEYQAILLIADQFPWQFKCLLILANETGHRLGAMLNLQWRDVDLVGGYITWRGATDKIGHQHVTPMTDGAKDAFNLARRHSPGIGDSRVLSAVTSVSAGITSDLARDWIQRAQVIAGLPVVKGKGYHGFRRKFASELRDAPVRNLLDLGGWKDYGTVVKCYQAPSNEGMRAALANRKFLEA